jgi:hypothetical protein
LALQSASPANLKAMPRVMQRLKSVRDFRAASKRKGTLSIANYPTKFNVEVLPKSPFLVIPEVSSERREYVPIGWLEPPTIPSNLVRIKLNASLYDFAILTSRMGMAWLSDIGGRLESRYRYSIGLVYNTLPWPTVTDAQRKKIEILAQSVLDARALYTTSSLGDLYDPETMPGNLRKAHAALDVAVDRLYRAAPFTSDRDRVEFLFGCYEKLTDPIGHQISKKIKSPARKRK